MSTVEGFCLSSQQRRLHDIQEWVVFDIHVDGGDMDNLRRSWVELATHHEILRTRFERVPGSDEILQVIESDAPPFLMPGEAPEGDVGTWAAGVERDGGLSLRLQLPSACLDAFSLEVVLADLAAAYQGLEPAEALQYVDLTDWLNELGLDIDQGVRADLDGRVKQAQASGLPFLGHVQRDGAFEFAELGIGRVDPRFESSFVAAAWAALLWRYVPEADVTVFTGFSNRGYDGMDRLIGPLLNPLPITLQPKLDMTFADLLLDWKCSRDRQADLEEVTLTGHAPFAFSSLPGLWVEAGGLRFELPHQPQLFPMTFDLHLVLRGNQLWIQYDSELFSIGQIRALGKSLNTLLQGLTENDRQPIGSYPLIDPIQLERPVSAPALWSDRIAERLVNTPEKPALSDGGETLSGAQLLAAVNGLADRLAQAGVGRHDRVPILLDRSRDVIVAMLAIHRLGAAWLVLDGKTPGQRLIYVLGDVGARLVVGDAALLPAGVDLPVIHPRQRAIHGTRVYQSIAQPQDAAYIIHTSGSTGKPKGVVVSNRALSAYLAAVIEDLVLPAHANYAHVSTLSADLGHTVLFPALMRGGVLHLIPDGVVADPSLLGDYFAAHQIDVLKIVPGHMAALLEDERPGRLIPNQCLIFGGERLDLELVQRVHDLKPGCRIFNHYGPSETTVGVLTTAIDPQSNCIPPLGFPLGDAEVEIREAGGLIAPPGIRGQITIGGPTLAEGYLGRDDLTRERFVDFDGRRTYLTGDLGFREVDDQGNAAAFVFIGRSDHQVKIRGHRVELGEIEQCLLLQPGVGEVAVGLIGEENQKRLTAWAVLDSSTDSNVLDGLKAVLPQHMIPDELVILERFPRTPNGKIDHKALPQPGQGGETSAFATEHEQALAVIWRDFFKTSDIHPHSNFFELGGNSLSATILLSRIRSNFQVSFGIVEMFAEPTIRGIARMLGSPGKRSGEPIGVVSRDRPLALSPSQQRLWVQDHLSAGSTAYNLPAAFRILGNFSFDTFRRAFDAVLMRHDILRTRFFILNDEPVQEAVNGSVSAELIDLCDGEQPDIQLAELREQMRTHNFDLSEPGLLRCWVVRLNENSHVLLFNMHHIITDAWSREIFIGELNAFYRDGAATLEALPLQYADYAVAARNADYSAGLAWWRGELEGMSNLDLPVDRPRSVHGLARAGRIPLEFEGDAGQRITALGDALGLTPFMTLMMVFQILLARQAGQRDFGIGFPVANRNRPELEGLIGFFVNTLVLRANLTVGSQGVLGVKELAQRVRTGVLAAIDHGDVPFERVGELRAGRDGGSPLFQVMFLYRDTPGGEVRLGDHKLVALPCQNPHAKFELTLEIECCNGGFGGWLEYNADLIEEVSACGLVKQFHYLLDHLDPDGLVCQQQLLSSADQLAQQLKRNRSFKARGPVEDLVARFERAVDLRPDHTALIFEDQQMSYAELDRRANQLAHALIAAGLKPGDPVGLDTERTALTVVRLLAVLKAGGFYVPLDPMQPSARLNQMTATVGPVIHLGRLPNGESITPHVSTHRPQLAITPQQPAYVLFTSGSTGVPKGVTISHGAMVNFLDAMTIRPGISDDDVLLAVTPLTFDISGLEIHLPLGAGATVDLAGAETVLDGAALAERVRSATMMQATPATWQMLLDSGWEPEPELRMLCGGEALPQALANALTTNGGCLFNLYGPTETTVWSSLAAIERGTAPHLGGPIDNTDFHVVSDQGYSLPDGAVGELLIGGAGLAQGYFGDPAKTALAFQPHPFSQTPGERLYRTGDLCRYQPNGPLQFLGRRDHQLKLRGFRIEAGEVRLHLERLGGVNSAAVLVRDQSLTAFVTAEPGWDLDPAFTSWRAELGAVLPEYMVPSRFVILESMPLNANGKWDYGALQSLEIAEEAAYQAPKTLEEVQMIQLWRQVLDIEQIGMNDHFFQLGGHSLSAIRLRGQISTVFEKQLSLRQIFDNPTPAGLCGLLEKGRDVVTFPSAKAPYQLSRPQQRLWVLERLGREANAYNMGGGLRLDGPLSLGFLRQALCAVVTRHEILRSRVVDRNDQPELVFDRVGFDLRVVDVSPADLDGVASQLIYKPYDLEKGPLFRVLLARLSAESHVLVIAAHHLVADDWSLGLFLNGMAEAYARLFQGRVVEPKPLRVRYVDHAARQWDTSFEVETAFWEKRLAGYGDLELPLDHPRCGQPRQGARVPIVLSQETTQRIGELGHTPYTVLLSVYQWMLTFYGRQKSVQVGASVSGRFHPDLEALIGFFVNTVVMRADVDETETFAQFLGRNARAVQEALDHSEVPLEHIIERVQINRDIPLFRAFFVLHSALDSQIGGDWSDVGLSSQWLEWPGSSPRFDLSLSLRETDQGMVGFIQYDATLFEAETIETMAGCYQVLLAEVLARPETGMDGFHFNTAGLVAPSVVRGDGLGVIDRFKSFAANTPAAACLRGEQDMYCAGRVETWSDNLAARLSGVGVETVVAIMAHRKPETVIAMLAVMKTGGVFLPIDPALPPQRKRLMLADSGARYIIDSTDPQLGVDFVSVTEPKQIQGFQAVKVPPEATAYMIYTSGSSGKPKAVGVTHANLNAYLAGLQDELKSRSGLNYGLVSGMSADLGHTVLFTALTQRGVLHILPKDCVLDAEAAADFFAAHPLDILKITPSHYRALLQTQRPERIVPQEWLVLGGEALDGEMVGRVAELNPNCKVLNHYGPTETTVGITRNHTNGKGLITIGKAFRGSHVAVVDSWLRPLPIGMIGELVVGGAQVTRGYFGRPDLTAAAMVPDPFGAFGGRLYRTGDLVRQRADGEIVFLGRLDDQLKIRGYRVEPSEVTVQLRTLSGVMDAAVLAIDGGLCAFVVSEDGDASLPRIQAALGDSLPEHMIPGTWLTLEALPGSSNGKLDRAVLQKLVAEQEAETGITSDLNERETLLAGVWSELLNCQRAILASDNFFTLGGDSILAIRLVTKARALGFEMKPADVFTHPTLGGLANHSGEPRSQAPQDKTVGSVALTPIQVEFFKRVTQHQNHYNQSLLLRLEQALNPVILEQSLAVLMEHHDALRFTYPVDEHGITQIALEQLDPHFEVVRLAGEWEIPTRAAQIQAGLSLGDGPLWRLVYFELDGDDHILWVCHHLIVDTLSWRFLTQDLLAIHTALIEERPPRLPLRTTSYRDWASALGELADDASIQTELSYWQGLGEVTNNPAGQPPLVEEVLVSWMDQVHSEALIGFEAAEPLLLAALARTLCGVFGPVLLDLESHGRHAFREDLDLTQTVGWFTCTYPLRLSLETVDEGSVRALQAAVPGNGLGYGLLKHIAQKSDMPAAWIRFNYAGHSGEQLPPGIFHSDLDRGPARGGSSGYVLDIQAGHSEKGLWFEWRYDPATLDVEGVRTFAAEMQTALTDLLAQDQAAPMDLLDYDTLSDVLSAFEE